MGSFYENILVLDRTTDDVLAALGSTPALVAPEVNGVVVVFHDDDAGSPPHAVAQPLSMSVHGAVVWFGVHDDDILSAALWHDGTLVAEMSLPDEFEYFDISEDELGEFAEMAADLGTPKAESSGPEAFVRGDRARRRDSCHGGADRGLRLCQRAPEGPAGRPRAPTFAASWGRRYLLADSAGYQGPELQPTG